jgi:hypothetical protein
MGKSQIEAAVTNVKHPGTPTKINSVLTRRHMLFFFLVLGVALRVWAYARDTSLYLDEILLSRNILELPLVQLLTKPLALDQVAPRGFLLIERLAVAIFGPSELALRLLPFVCGIASIVLFWRLAERIVTDSGSVTALFLFAIGVPFIRFGAEVKQYECDLLAAVFLPLLVLRLLEQESSTRRFVVTGLAGFGVIWFSQASVLVMAGLGAALALSWLVSRDRKTGYALLFTIPLWALASLVAVVVGERSMTPATREYMHDFWAGAFFPAPFRFGLGARWIGQRFVEFFSDATLLRYRWPVVFALLAMGGFVMIWKRSRLAAGLLCGPVIVALAAAIAHQYPFRGRLVLWLLPGALLAVAEGTDWIRRKVHVLNPVAGVLVIIAVSAAPVMALVEAPPPYEIEHHREVLGYLQQHRQPGDVVYVMQLGEVGTRFYGPNFGLQPTEWITGACDRDDSRAFLRDVDRFRGTPRLWVLAGSGRPLLAVRSAVLRYLQSIGIRRDAKSFPSMLYGSITIELYDLTDPTHLATASAATFSVPPMPRDPRIACREWTKPAFEWHVSAP